MKIFMSRLNFLRTGHLTCVFCKNCLSNFVVHVVNKLIFFFFVFLTNTANVSQKKNKNKNKKKKNKNKTNTANVQIFLPRCQNISHTQKRLDSYIK